jgi:sirohydrochlorin ferrochelatase
MKVVLVDNGSLEAASHEALRAAASAVGRLAGVRVDAVSWKHSNRIPREELVGGPAWTLAPWVRAQVAAGEKEFVFIPYFVSPQGAVGSALRSDLDGLREDAGHFDFSFTGGLSDGDALPRIVADRVRQAVAALGLETPGVVVVDHGGPSRASAAIRDQVAAAAGERLSELVSRVLAASMESPDGPGFEHNLPLLADALAGQGDVVIAPLFLSPGRHAGPGGDLQRIALLAEARSPGLRCHFTELVGTHPVVAETLSQALLRALHTAAHT